MKLGYFAIAFFMSTLYNLGKRASLFIVPGVCFGLIFLDWFHTYQWKRGQKRSVIDDLLGQGNTLTDDANKLKVEFDLFLFCDVKCEHFQ